MRTDTSGLIVMAASEDRFFVLMTGGRGGSATSESVKRGNWGTDGGYEAVIERSFPGWRVCIYSGSQFMQEFTAEYQDMGAASI